MLLLMDFVFVEEEDHLIIEMYVRQVQCHHQIQILNQSNETFDVMTLNYTLMVYISTLYNVYHVIRNMYMTYQRIHRMIELMIVKEK